MTGHNENMQRIAKNTMMLYVRMMFMMFLGLFTSRIVLTALGEDDFGVYNVVGGVVAMFTVISGSLTAAVTRFITFEMGKGSQGQVQKVYSTAVLVLALLSLIVAVLAEPVGLWFIENEMTIEPSRIPAARWVLHFSILSFVINLMSVPQMASITAHEQMSVYAGIGILDGVLRFVVALLTSRSSFDRLALYAALMTSVVLVVRLAYGIYCRRHIPECRYRMVFEPSLLKEMFAFASWNFIGSASGVLRDQGGNILINVFFGTAVNAARGVAAQLNGAIQSFVTNFMTAVNPQITKSYASGDKEYTFALVRKSSRMSYYLLFVFALPVLFTTDYLMELWLKDVPEYSVSFVQLFLVFSLCESLSRPLMTALLATGRIRNYQLTVGGIQLLNIPISYIVLTKGGAPEMTIVVSIVISVISLFMRLLMFSRMTGFSIRYFLKQVLLNVFVVTVSALAIPFVLSEFYCADDFLSFGVMASITFLAAVLSVFYLGMTGPERKSVLKIFRFWT